MFHAGQPTAFRDRLVERVACRNGAKEITVAGTETGYAVRIEEEFRYRKQIKTVDIANGALVGRIEFPQGFDFIAKQVDPDGALCAWWKQVNQPAARSKFAAVGHRVHAHEAVRVKEGDQLFLFDRRSWREPGDKLLDPLWLQNTLRDRVDGRDDQLRPAERHCKPGQGGQPIRSGVQRRGCTIIGQAIPCWKFDNIEIGRKKTCGLDNGAHCRIVGGDKHSALARPDCDFGQKQRTIADRHAGQRHACFRGQ